MLDTHACNRAKWRHRDRLNDAWTEWDEIRKTIGDRVHDDDGDSRGGNMLLEGQVAIDGDQSRKARGTHRGQQITITKTGPALIASRGHSDARERITKATRHALVEQDLHYATARASSSSLASSKTATA